MTAVLVVGAGGESAFQNDQSQSPEVWQRGSCDGQSGAIASTA